MLSLAASMVLCLGASTFAKAEEPTYRTVTEVYDWGAAISRVIVDLGKDVKTDSVTQDTFKVYVKRNVPQEKGSAQAEELEKKLSASEKAEKGIEGYREITKAYVADKDGNMAKAGRYVAIEMKVSPTLMLASPLNFSMKTMLNQWIQCDYTITQIKDIQTKLGKLKGLVVTKSAGNLRPVVDEFTFGEQTNDNITLHYASFTSVKGQKKNPLIIWLHGMGEGGTDPSLTITANKACAFATPQIQSYFGGAYVLAPQTPTFWMDGFKSFGDGTSKYEKSLMALINNYVARHEDIDPKRIYLGGDSNGGYMTMVLIRDYPEYFAAAFPTCEALADKLISDQEIQKMKNTPIWFTAAKTDPVVPVADYVVPTHQRLLAAGAQKVYLSLFDNVHDTTGLYNDATGKPFEYMGHWSWIYVYNNECVNTIDSRKVTLMEWLAAQKLK
jgi:predicted peptidase